TLLFILHLHYFSCSFSFNATLTPVLYTLSLHDALPICAPRLIVSDLSLERVRYRVKDILARLCPLIPTGDLLCLNAIRVFVTLRSEEHTSELQSLAYLVCRLLLEKKKKIINTHSSYIII